MDMTSMAPRITEDPAGAGATGDTDDQQGTASAQSAYVKPTDGQPTICENCMHFDGSGKCDHPEVIADPEVQGAVEANGHSKFYSPKSEEQGEANRLPTTGEGVDKLGSGVRSPKPRGGYGLVG